MTGDAAAAGASTAGATSTEAAAAATAGVPWAAAGDDFNPAPRTTLRRTGAESAGGVAASSSSPATVTGTALSPSSLKKSAALAFLASLVEAAGSRAEHVGAAAE